MHRNYNVYRLFVIFQVTIYKIHRPKDLGSSFFSLLDSLQFHTENSIFFYRACIFSVNVWRRGLCVCVRVLMLGMGI